MSVDCPLDDELEGFEGALRERFVRHRRREARLNVTPHIAQNISGRRSAIDARTTRHGGYVVSQQKRKRIEESFGWGKTIGGLARPMLRGVKKLVPPGMWLEFAARSSNLKLSDQAARSIG
jgi:hypothetical protein